MTDRVTETVEILAGERPRAMPDAAVRIGDLQGLLTLSTRLQAAAPAGATPTAAEFEALRRDVVMLHQRLVAVVDAMQRRLTGARS